MATDTQITSVKLWTPEPLHLGTSNVRALMTVASTGSATQIHLLTHEGVYFKPKSSASPRQLPPNEEGCCSFSHPVSSLGPQILSTAGMASSCLSSLIHKLLHGRKVTGYWDLRWFYLKTI